MEKKVNDSILSKNFLFMIFVTHMEITPNPNALKYVLNETILSNGTCEYRLGDDEQCLDLLVKNLFAIEGVERVFYAKNYVTVNKNTDIDWLDIEQKIKDIINANIENTEFKEQAPIKKDFGNKQELIDEINEVLDETIRPGLEMDGGGIEVVGIDDDMRLSILYFGACESCPSAEAGTLTAIQRILQDTVNPEITVGIVGEEHFK